jgi:hypothetical protein
MGNKVTAFSEEQLEAYQVKHFRQYSHDFWGNDYYITVN